MYGYVGVFLFTLLVALCIDVTLYVVDAPCNNRDSVVGLNLKDILFGSFIAGAVAIVESTITYFWRTEYMKKRFVSILKSVNFYHSIWMALSSVVLFRSNAMCMHEPIAQYLLAVFIIHSFANALWSNIINEQTLLWILDPDAEAKRANNTTVEEGTTIHSTDVLSNTSYSIKSTANDELIEITNLNKQNLLDVLVQLINGIPMTNSTTIIMPTIPVIPIIPTAKDLASLSVEDENKYFTQV